MFDIVGQEIKVGDYIIYAYNLSRSAALKFGRVVAFQEPKEDVCRKEPWIVVGGVERWSWRNEWKLQSRHGFLQFPERIIVIRPEQVPQQAFMLLKDII